MKPHEAACMHNFLLSLNVSLQRARHRWCLTNTRVLRLHQCVLSTPTEPNYMNRHVDTNHAGAYTFSIADKISFKRRKS